MNNMDNVSPSNMMKESNTHLTLDNNETTNSQDATPPTFCLNREEELMVYLREISGYYEYEQAKFRAYCYFKRDHVSQKTNESN